MARITPLIMCGGAGTRLWPASRRNAPKQFINLLGSRSTFQDTVLRVADPDLFERPVVITNDEYRHMVADQLQAVGVEGEILLEPARRDSGPAIAAGAHLIAQGASDALVLVLAADHVVRHEAAFLAAVREAAEAAREGRIVTFGVKPDHPSTAYGYIARAAGARAHGVAPVAAFVEKPDAEKAARYLAEGYLWNAGNFLFRADVMLGEYARFDAATVAAASGAVERGERDLGWLRLDAESFSACASLSIDFAVMEKSDRVSVIPVDMGWSDVGSWHAVWELSEKDESGNAGPDDAVFVDARGNLVASDRLTCLVGVDDLAVIVTDDAALVFNRGDAEAMRALVAELTQRERSELVEHLEVFRPWGSYRRVDKGERFQVKRIVVKPGGRLSLQKHFHRAEHWVVVRGTARVTVDEAEIILRENESTYIPLGAVHCLENPGKIPLELIEVQSGSYLGEDDIVRLEDIYNRA
ncbi:MAG: mannose-1-phosphate guanylyltransferase/mannose-6-phosphate isomerase [Salinarimonadaceae bacterium]|nr:MAG: mannose-1-phosphate guanylyltransferase/mannose-6-phosphate isomerase [Salinarimonadaceae bacterium]